MVKEEAPSRGRGPPCPPADGAEYTVLSALGSAWPLAPEPPSPQRAPPFHTDSAPQGPGGLPDNGPGRPRGSPALSDGLSYTNPTPVPALPLSCAGVKPEPHCAICKMRPDSLSGAATDGSLNAVLGPREIAQPEHRSLCGREPAPVPPSTRPGHVLCPGLLGILCVLCPGICDLSVAAVSLRRSAPSERRSWQSEGKAGGGFLSKCRPEMVARGLQDIVGSAPGALGTQRRWVCHSPGGSRPHGEVLLPAWAVPHMGRWPVACGETWLSGHLSDALRGSSLLSATR